MCMFQYDDDPDPEEQVPAGLLYVPVRPEAAGRALRMFRTALGERAAVGFTSQDLLAATLGAGQPSIRLAESLLRSLTSPLGVSRLVVDPVFSAAAVSTEPVHTAEEPVRSL
ncbi:SAV_915 family protein [Streptomyces sp. NPDC088116]|uniref:SAV_915 family protein n=1 Tax=Streptomyces sp. NPDC088116 TaxID=3365825 RepID=UPI00380823EB